MKMKQKKFRIGELAQKLQVERFVIRFWEKEFSLSFSRSSGGQRFYDMNDFTTFQQIKKLLYDEGFTISGAKKKLLTLSEKASTPAIKTSPTTRQDHFARKTVWDEKIVTQFGTLKKHLRKLRELL